MDKEYNKLIRDNIPSIIEESGKNCIITVIHNLREIKDYHKKKVLEELDELKNILDFNLYSSEEMLNELVDIVEIMWYYLYDKKITKSEMNKLYNTLLNKRSKRGAFDKNIILKRVFDKRPN